MALRTGGSRGALVHEINVTPMADIMIVLLIIFMVTTPMIVNGPVKNLPAAHSAEQKQEELVVSIAPDTTTYLGADRLRSLGELLPRLEERLGGLGSDDRIVYLKADADLPYAEVMRVLDLCRRAGAEQVALMTAPHIRS